MASNEAGLECVSATRSWVRSDWGMTKHTFQTGQSREQASPLPARIEDYVGPDNPVRAIEAFADGLDLAALGFSLAEGGGSAGQPPFVEPTIQSYEHESTSVDIQFRIAQELYDTVRLNRGSAHAVILAHDAASWCMGFLPRRPCPMILVKEERPPCCATGPG